MTAHRLVVTLSAAVLAASGATMLHASQPGTAHPPPPPPTVWAWSAPPESRTDGGVGHPGSAPHRYVTPDRPESGSSDGAPPGPPAGPWQGRPGAPGPAGPDGVADPDTGGEQAAPGPRRPGSPERQPESAAAPGGTPPADDRSDGGDPARRRPESAPSERSGTDDPPSTLGRSEPVRLDIPAIGVRTPLIRLGLNADGTVQVPPLRPNSPAGWYTGMVTPGERGPAVILGHVDTADAGPAVFYNLAELRPGDTVSVRREDGRTAVFTVRRTATYPKRKFPTDSVYGPIDHAGLRLVTCGGTFDRARGSYRDVVVVYARLSHHVSPPAPSGEPGGPRARSGRQKWI